MAIINYSWAAKHNYHAFQVLSATSQDSAARGRYPRNHNFSFKMVSKYHPILQARFIFAETGGANTTLPVSKGTVSYLSKVILPGVSRPRLKLGRGLKPRYGSRTAHKCATVLQGTTKVNVLRTVPRAGTPIVSEPLARCTNWNPTSS